MPGTRYLWWLTVSLCDSFSDDDSLQYILLLPLFDHLVSTITGTSQVLCKYRTSEWHHTMRPLQHLQAQPHPHPHHHQINVTIHLLPAAHCRLRALNTPDLQASGC